MNASMQVSCGQVSVTGGGNGIPGPLVAIPGLYTGYEPGILIVWFSFFYEINMALILHITEHI
jgi:hypothetical protein